LSSRKSSWRFTVSGATRKGTAWDNQKQTAAPWACIFLAKVVLDLKTIRALIERLQADSKLRRLCGFDEWWRCAPINSQGYWCDLKAQHAPLQVCIPRTCEDAVWVK
jgi:hypothetical protein